jgi:hypothetical protein
MGQRAWGVTSLLPIFVSHRSSAFLRVIRPIDFVTELTAALHAGTLVSCHNFLSLRLCFNSRSIPGILLFMSESITLLFASLYAAAMESRKYKFHRQWHLTLWYFGGPQYLARHRFPQKNNEWDIVVLKFWIRSSRIKPLISRLKGFKVHYSKTGF